MRVILTASHNPMEWNALKLLNHRGEFLSAEDAKNLLQMVDDESFSYADVQNLGNCTEYAHSIHDHIEAVLRLKLVDVDAIRSANFSIIIDAVNSTGAIAIPILLSQLGVKCITVLNDTVNGIFAHNPEPLPEHLTQISEKMRKSSYDAGFVVDPDVDRLAIIMENGEMFGEEYTLIAVADWVLQHQKGAAVSNLSSTRALEDLCKKHGVEAYKSAVGEVNVVEMMKAKNAVIGGEGNGGVIYPELHYGRDALAGIALFLTYLAKSGMSCSNLRKKYSHYCMIKDKIKLDPEMNIQSILLEIKEKYKDFNPNTIDGVKIDFEDSWVHLRTSNTEPIIRIYAEAPDTEQAKILNENIKNDIQSILNKA
jgi:phosphomannomutase